MTAHDWMLILFQAGSYVMHDIFKHEKRNDALLSLLNTTSEMATVVSGWKDDNTNDLQELRLQLTEAACKMEAVLPATELSPLFHILIHVPDMIYRWNNIRNFWCFFGERYPLVPILSHGYLFVPLCTQF